jgi:hypothetical protein
MGLGSTKERQHSVMSSRIQHLFIAVKGTKPTSMRGVADNLDFAKCLACDGIADCPLEKLAYY